MATACGGSDANTDGGNDGSTDGAQDATGDRQFFDAPAPDDAADAQPPVDAGPCTYGDPSGCPQGWYCDAPTCTTGVCAQKPAMDSQTRAPVCGCDDVTYWNPAVAAVAGMSVKAQGECKAPKTCNEMGSKCAGGAKCNFHLVSANACAALNHSGTCWMLPKQCPQVVIGPQTRECGANTCTAECDLIKGEKAYWTDNTCPQ
jgi:hypothetical protein